MQSVNRVRGERGEQRLGAFAQLELELLPVERNRHQEMDLPPAGPA
jgi:hypothetical protein